MLVLPALFNYAAALIYYGMPTICSIGIIGKFSVSSNHGKRIMNIKIDGSPLLLSRGDPGFPIGGCANPQGEAPTSKLARFSQKLHEIKNILLGGGVLFGHINMNLYRTLVGLERHMHAPLPARTNFLYLHSVE